MRRHITLASLILVFTSILLAGALSQLPALAASTGATFVVTNLHDSGSGSLRDEIDDANAYSGPSTITFQVNGTIVLSSTLPAIDNDITIDGTGHAITVSGNSSVQVMIVDVSGTLSVQAITIADGVDSSGCNGYTCGGSISNSGKLFVMNASFVRNGNTTCQGGGLLNFGTFSVTNTTFSGNAAYQGGGILNLGTLTVTNDNFSSNNGKYGGGIYNIGSLAVTSSTFSGNGTGWRSLGGGIYNTGWLIVTSSTFSVNNAYDYGGGIYNDSGSLNVVDSSFLSNLSAAGGGIFNNYGDLSVLNSSFSGNTSGVGSGINNNYGAVDIADSTFQSNTSAFGGGILNWGTVIITNSTFSGNSANGVPGGGGGGIFNYRQLTVINSTFSSNSAFYSGGYYGGDSFGGGIYNYTGAVNLTNTIIANSTSGGDCVNAGSFTGDHNLIMDAYNACGLTNGIAGNIIGVDPQLGPLADNGGSMLTFLPMPGSPAISAGDNASCPPIDQRGVVRPQGAICDIGSVESLIWPRVRLLMVMK